MTRSEARAYAEKKGDQTFVDDIPSCSLIMAKCRDEASMMIFSPAIAEKIEDYWIVIPEHHEAQVFHEEEYDVFVYRRVADAQGTL